MFFDEAIQLGRDLTRIAVRHGGRCSWFSDNLVDRDGVWQRNAAVLGPDFATGTAGVGWFLSRLSRVADDPEIRTIATEAVRQSLSGAVDLIAARRLGFHEGAMGVAWAAIDSARELSSAELFDNGMNLARRVVAAAASSDGNAPGLWNGSAGMLTGMLAVPELPAGEVAGSAKRISTELRDWVYAKHAGGDKAGIGLAYGASGVGIALAACSCSVPESIGIEPALDAFRAERAWLSPGRSWNGSTAHAWLDDWMVPCSLCSGAAGIGIARLNGFAQTSAPHLLAEAGAAIELIRRGAHLDPADDCLCHGTAGYIELMLRAWDVLGEQAHLQAARNLGNRMISRARAHGRYRSGFGIACASPSLFLGTAGTALVLLRLHDPAIAPSAVLPVGFAQPAENHS